MRDGLGDRMGDGLADTSHHGARTIARLLGVALTVAGLLAGCATPGGAGMPRDPVGRASAVVGSAVVAPDRAIQPIVPVEANPLGRLPPGGVIEGRRLRTLLAVADTEWRRWGGQRVSANAQGELCAVLASGRCEPVDDGCGREQMPGLCAIVDQYWDSIQRTTGIRRFRHDCSRSGVCEARWPGPEPALDTPAWSAAFISALFTRAGFGADEFLPSPYHADYVVAARDARAQAYEVVPTPAWVAPGDLICSTRATRRVPDPPRTVADLRASGLGGGPTPMHCDLIIAVDQSRRMAYAIGGNVLQSVALIDVPLDLQGRVSGEVQPDRAWLLAMRLRPAWRAMD